MVAINCVIFYPLHGETSHELYIPPTTVGRFQDAKNAFLHAAVEASQRASSPASTSARQLPVG